MRLALRGPRNGCVATAMSTGGSVFDANKWLPDRAVSGCSHLLKYSYSLYESIRLLSNNTVLIFF